jgi:hypothetical protein
MQFTCLSNAFCCVVGLYVDTLQMSLRTQAYHSTQSDITTPFKSLNIYRIENF